MRARLDETREFRDFLLETLRGAMTQWRERVATPGVTKIVETDSSGEIANAPGTSTTAETTAHPSRPARQTRDRALTTSALTEDTR